MTAEERYDIECQIDALYDEADYCDDHNDPNRAVAARNEATELRKKLDADDTKECFSEEYTDENPFDVDWDEVDEDDDEDNLQEDALITEDLCVFRVNFNKIPDDFKEFKSEEEAIKFAKDNLSDEPHVFKKCGDKEPEEIASYQDWTYGVREELEADAKALDVEEDYTGNPEERTDHLDYVDDNPTDDKFKFPKNITKKEDDHCEKVNLVINHDPDDKKVLKESLAGFSFEKGDSIVDKYEAWADVYVKAQSGGEIIINIEGPTPDEVDDCFYLDISGGWSKYDNRDVGLGYDWEFECDGVSVDPGPIDRALNCFDAKLQKLENDDPVDVTVAEACQILQVSPDTLAVIIADAKKEVLQYFMEEYEDYIYDNIYDFVEYDPDDYDD